MRRGWFLAVLLVGCNGGNGGDDASPPDLALGPPSQKTAVDILFVLGNEPSPSGHFQLIARFPDLFNALQASGPSHPVSYHIGVITPDLGAAQFVLGGGQCHPGGDGAKLIAVGPAADVTCMPPTGGVPFIDYDQVNGTNNLPSGQSFATTFGCMAATGDRGCGFQQHLEAAYQALHDPIPENAGFLRDDALLVVLFQSDKDDCSMPSDSDLPDPSPAGVSKYGPLLSFRCVQFGTECGQPPMTLPYAPSNGDLSPCQGADPSVSPLFPVSKYVDYFTLPSSMGGVKADPRDVILAGITPPAAPFEIIAANSNPNPPGPYVTCPPPYDGIHCAIVVQHSCIAPSNTQFFGDPAVRIRQVIDSTFSPQETSTCDTSYQAAMQSLGQLIVSRVQ